MIISGNKVILIFSLQESQRNYPSHTDNEFPVEKTLNMVPASFVIFMNSSIRKENKFWKLLNNKSENFARTNSTFRRIYSFAFLILNIHKNYKKRWKKSLLHSFSTLHMVKHTKCCAKVLLYILHHIQVRLYWEAKLQKFLPVGSIRYWAKKGLRFY